MAAFEPIMKIDAWVRMLDNDVINKDKYKNVPVEPNKESGGRIISIKCEGLPWKQYYGLRLNTKNNKTTKA